MFNLFQTYVASFLSGCCVYVHVANICFRCFIQMLQVFHLDVAYILQWFSSVFRRFCLFQVFRLSSLYVASGYFKSSLSVAYGMRVGNGSRCRPATGASKSVKLMFPCSHASSLRLPPYAAN
jgi:hypothetical protein